MSRRNMCNMSSLPVSFVQWDPINMRIKERYQNLFLNLSLAVRYLIVEINGNICKQTRLQPLLHSCHRFNGGFRFSFCRVKISIKGLNISIPDIYEYIMYNTIVLCHVLNQFIQKQPVINIMKPEEQHTQARRENIFFQHSQF